MSQELNSIKEKQDAQWGNRAVIGRNIEQSEVRLKYIRENIRKVKTLPKSTLRKNKLKDLNHIRQRWEETHRSFLKELDAEKTVTESNK